MTLKSILASFAVASALFLGACNSTVSVTDVQNAAQVACSFLPTVATIEALLGANNSSWTTANQVASAICGSLKTAGVKPSVVAPGVDATVTTITVNGKQIPIVGHFVVNK